MHNFHKLRIYELARKNLREIRAITQNTNNIGDLHNQILRAAISVVSNIAEGSGQRTNKQFNQFLGHARASNAEVHAQLDIMVDCGEIEDKHPVLDEVDHFGAMCTRFMQQLEI